MPRLRLRSTLWCALAAVVLTASASHASGGASAVVSVHAAPDGRPVTGTGVVVASDARQGAVFVLTAAPLFRRADGESARANVQVRIGEQLVSVGPDHVLHPVGDLSGIAVLRVDAHDAGGLLPAVDVVAIDSREMALGSVFLVAVSGPGGQRVDVPERVQFGSTRLVVGDRGLAHLPACVGAPALTEGGVSGVVVDCAAGRAPVVALTSAVSGFLRRHLPAAVSTASRTGSPFTLTERVLAGPLLTVGCDGVTSGEVDVPFVLSRQEQPVDAKAALLNATSLRLAETAVLGVGAHAVKVRFTLVGTPPPRYVAPGTCAGGQALLTVRLDVVSVPER